MLLMLSTDRSKHECVSLYKKMEVLRPTPSTAQEMTKFHSNDYVAFMQNVRSFSNRAAFCSGSLLSAPPAQVTPDNYQDQKFSSSLKRFSVGEDCPVFDGLYKCAPRPRAAAKFLRANGSDAGGGAGSVNCRAGGAWAARSS